MNDKLKRLDEIADAATPGPWFQDCVPPGPHGQKVYSNAVKERGYPHAVVVERAYPAHEEYDKKQSFADMVYVAAVDPDNVRALLRIIELQQVALEVIRDDTAHEALSRVEKIADELTVTP